MRYLRFLLLRPLGWLVLHLALGAIWLLEQTDPTLPQRYRDHYDDDTHHA